MHHFVHFAGSIPAGLTSDDSESEDKKPSPPSIPPPGGGDGGRPLPPSSSSSPQPTQHSSLVSSHDYNMEQSNVKLLKAELKVGSARVPLQVGNQGGVYAPCAPPFSFCFGPLRAQEERLLLRIKSLCGNYPVGQEALKPFRRVLSHPEKKALQFGSSLLSWA